MGTVNGWMTGCHLCVRLLRAYDVAQGPDMIEAWDAVRAHVVQEHADRLPSSRVNCGKCVEFVRALNYGPNIVAPGIRGLLERLNAEHRAGHLLEYVPDIYRRPAA